MPAPLVLASPDRLRLLAGLRERKRLADEEALRNVDAFALLGYEPICLPRQAARKRGDAEIPEPCGQCPQEQFHAATEDDVLYGGSAGGGKGGRCPDRASPSYDVSMETKVLTPKGFRLFGDIRPGDQVCNPDGTVARVIRVTDNGPKQFYRITLADGSSVEADEDHLWAITISAYRTRRKSDVPVIPAGLRPEDEWNLRVQSRCKIVSTLELRELVLRAAGEKARGERPRYVLLPLTMPVNMTGAKGRWPVLSPYTLGAIVGDGSTLSRSVTITGEDEETFGRIRAELPEGLHLVPVAGEDRCPAYRITRRDGTAEGPPAAQAEFAAAVRQRREAAGLGQRDLATLSGVTQAYLSLIERCQKWPGRKIAERLDEALSADGELSALHVTRTEESAAVLLARDGLMDLHSWEKFIPERLKAAPAADRFAFMQGLMDTDGYMDDRGHVELVTVSERLAKDAQEVLRSLGYRATLSTKTPTYTHKGEKREGRLAYRLYIQGRHLDRLFHLARKRERVTRYNGGDVEPWHRVVSVEPTVIDNSKCIQVDNLNHLYVTDDYIVTHNTAAIVAESLKSCAKYPGIRILILRRSYDELAESIYPEFQRFSWGAALGGRLNKTEKEVTFPNGSLIRLRYMETLDDASRRQGGAYQLVFVDERTLLAPGIVDVIALERLRSAHGVPVIGIRSTSNPGGPGHGEVRARYIDPTEHGRKVVTDDHGLTVRFIPARATDNPHLDEAYFRRLDAIPDPARRAAMRDGDWGQFAGQMFPELRWDRHSVDPFALPASWRRYSSVDWGYTAPWAVLWGAVDEDGRLWAYREIYETQVGEAEQARRILAAEGEGEHVAARLADDAMWATRGDAKPISQVYAENGVHLAPAGKGPGSRVSGWQRVHTYLSEGPACLIHRAMGWETCPMIHFFRTLAKTWWELANLPHATRGDPEDADSSAPDHLMDALRYWLLNVGGGAEAWINWAKKKAELAAAAAEAGNTAPPSRPALEGAEANAGITEADPVPLTDEERRRQARNEAFRQQQGSR